jgi:ATP-dependent Clp endopeptidase proteolytic subunit ClpP
MERGARPLRSTRRIANLQASRPGWYRITNAAAAGKPTVVSIYDEIGFMGVAAGEFLADLAGITGAIELHINSPGGDVFDGVAIYNTLKQRKDDVHVIVDGLAASAASFIAQAASPGQLEMAPSSMLMIHEGFAMVIGSSEDMVTTAALLDKVSDTIASIYADRSGKPAAHWRDAMRAETWYSDSEAVEAGLADRITGSEGPKDAWDLSVFAHAPGSEPARQVDDDVVRAEAGGMTVINADGSHVSMTGEHEHDHPASGGQGGDASHAHAHSHDGNNNHEHEHAPANRAPADTWNQPGDQPGFPVLNADFDNSPWDASKAWAAGAASDDPAAFYRGICAGRKAGDPATQGAWALPYKYAPSRPANAAGVRNALGRLPQTKGLTNEGEARATLERLMKQINPDWEPSDLIDPELLSAALTYGLEGAEA